MSVLDCFVWALCTSVQSNQSLQIPLLYCHLFDQLYIMYRWSKDIVKKINNHHVSQCCHIESPYALPEL